MKLLFVPFLTDTQNGYTRVRHCAMARAIENECYVAIAGGVGNLAKVNHMDIQYAQSALFTPCVIGVLIFTVSPSLKKQSKINLKRANAI
jgi:predicted amidohydrolase